MDRSVAQQVGFTEDFKAGLSQGHPGLIDVVDVQGHGGPAVGVDNQRVGIVNVDFGL